MKRRDFIATSIAGVTSSIGIGCASAKKVSKVNEPGFDVHPFVKSHPEAVFIYLTSAKDKKDTETIRNAGYNLTKDLIVSVPSGGRPLSTKINIKPNWTATSQFENKPVFEALGVNTDPNFVEGCIQSIQSLGMKKIYLRECAKPSQWKDMGYRALADRNHVDLRDLSSKDFWKYGKDAINFVDIPDGVVMKRIGYMSPFNEQGTFLLDIAKFKAHGMGITASIKNLQGICGRLFHTFCPRYDTLRKNTPEKYRQFFHENFEKNIEELYAKHLKDGIPRWDKPGQDGGIWMEEWVQRMLDSYSVTPTGLCMVEGIYGQDGNGFGLGPHEKIGPIGTTSRDYMSNVVTFGIDPFRVDIITHWLGGHEPGNFGLFHIGIERGFSNVLDPHDIPVYLWKDGQATLAKLEDFQRTPLATYYLQRDYNGQNEPKYHICDEPFDYSAWKNGKRASITPSIKELGFDSERNVVMEMNVPRKEDVYVEVLNAQGEKIWRLHAPDLEPGVHQVVWDGFDKPGVYNVYLKGMRWDAEKRIVEIA